MRPGSLLPEVWPGAGLLLALTLTACAGAPPEVTATAQTTETAQATVTAAPPPPPLAPRPTAVRPFPIRELDAEGLLNLPLGEPWTTAAVLITARDELMGRLFAEPVGIGLCEVPGVSGGRFLVTFEDQGAFAAYIWTYPDEEERRREWRDDGTIVDGADCNGIFARGCGARKLRPPMTTGCSPSATQLDPSFEVPQERPDRRPRYGVHSPRIPRQLAASTYQFPSGTSDLLQMSYNLR